MKTKFLHWRQIYIVSLPVLQVQMKMKLLHWWQISPVLQVQMKISNENESIYIEGKFHLFCKFKWKWSYLHWGQISPVSQVPGTCTCERHRGWWGLSSPTEAGFAHCTNIWKTKRNYKPTNFGVFCNFFFKIKTYCTVTKSVVKFFIWTFSKIALRVNYSGHFKRKYWHNLV